MKNTNAQILLFSLHSTKCVSNEHPCLKTTRVYDDFFLLLYSLLQFLYFIFSAPISFSLCIQFCIPVFYNKKDLLELTPKKDVLFIIGDWNTKVGSQEIPEVTGKFDLEVQNEAG